ncbi:isoprenoid synthase domain-containing protein [Armillaria borealis]|uniref:Terpene synthase n=1 Tax=Armillaria borealis TaxID=47425 RepID=A0AA39MJP7_9AGAR|nr:isoprenoid synthase domain-containing protein [Armillaria borealis]
MYNVLWLLMSITRFIGFSRMPDSNKSNPFFEHLRIVCDLMNLFFAFDEYSDNAPPEVVRQYADIVMDAVRSPIKPRPSDEVVLGVIAQEYSYSCLFWALCVKSASSTSRKHFVESLGHYVDSVVQEAEDRHRGHIRNVEDYFDLRRLDVGVDPSFSMIGLEYDLPDEVFHHPTVVALQGLGRDMIILDNDLASYNKEQALQEHPHNIVVCVMNELQCDVHAAISWVENLHWSTRNKYLSGGPEIDPIAAHYLHGIANWVRAGECWNFERVLEWHVQRRMKYDVLGWSPSGNCTTELKARKRLGSNEAIFAETLDEVDE